MTWEPALISSSAICERDEQYRPTRCFTYAVRVHRKARRTEWITLIDDIPEALRNETSHRIVANAAENEENREPRLVKTLVEAFCA
jgi:hypothetical protein